MGEASQLHMKLSAILGEVSGIPKSGFNSFHNYAYAQESDVLDSIRPKLAESGISVVVSTDRVEVKEVLQGSKLLTIIQGTIIFTDSESGEYVHIPIAGNGMDNQDKGLPKAITMAVKYGLMKTFLMGTPDDAEHDQAEQHQAVAAPRPPLAPAPPAAAVAGPSTSGDEATERLPWETEAEAAEYAARAAVPGPPIAAPTPAPAPPRRAPAPRAAAGGSAKLISEAQGRLLFGRAKGLGLENEQRDAIILQITGQPNINGVQWDQMDQILEAYAAFAAQ